MATQKKSTRRKTAAPATEESAQAQAERMSRHFGESVHEIWLAGIGALGRAQAEGSKLFESLVKEGQSMEQSTRKHASGRIDAMRGMFESTVGQARERAVDTWDNLGKAFEDRLHRALRQLDLPSREDIDQLNRRIDALSPGQRTPAAASAPRKGGARKVAAKKTPSPRSPASGQATRKRSRRSAEPAGG